LGKVKKKKLRRLMPPRMGTNAGNNFYQIINKKKEFNGKSFN